MLLSCGDALIDFLPVAAADGHDAMRPKVGGSCFNVAVGMARLGAPCGFVGGISTDLFGRMIEDYAVESMIDLQFATRSAHQTKLAFVTMVGGQPSYAFYDENTASRNWSYQRGSIPFRDIDAIHLGSTTLIDANAMQHAFALIADAQGSTTISLDPNCRPSLVANKGHYVAGINAFAAAADIIKLSDVDFDYLYGGDDYAAKAITMLAAGAKLVVLTRGDHGALAWHAQAGEFEIAAPQVRVVDTVGAGDSFQAALLFALRAIGRIERRALAGTTADELSRVLTFAATCGAIACTRAGANPPRRAELDAATLALLEPSSRAGKALGSGGAGEDAGCAIEVHISDSQKK
jgi:fructokinase